jgi:Hemerythrin HHE cation binding domain
MPETIYDALRDSHETQRTLLRKVLRSKAGTGSRIALFAELRVELSAHEAAEERYLYVPILMDDMGLSSSRHALHEHHEIDELIEDVQGMDPTGEAWFNKVKELSKQVHHHLREEERKFFQVSGKILNDTQKTRLARQYRRDYARMVKVLRTTHWPGV